MMYRIQVYDISTSMTANKKILLCCLLETHQSKYVMENNIIRLQFSELHRANYLIADEYNMQWASYNWLPQSCLYSLKLVARAVLNIKKKPLH